MNGLVPESSIQDRLHQHLLDWVTESQSIWKENLLAVIHFGSTSRSFIKYETDVDLLLVFKSLPTSRWDRFQFINPEEVALELKLKTLSPYSLYPSILTWSESSFVQFHTLYIDFVDSARIIYEYQSTATEVIQKTKDWLDEVGAVKHKKGNLWYWDVNPSKKKNFHWGYKSET